jgi:nucleoside-diphosphate-sugar epimerase
MAESLRIILTGATGMVGEGVLLTCLDHPAVEQVLMVNRRSYPLQHPKLKELLLPDFMQSAGVADQLSGYNACFFCAGISSVGMSEEKYTQITYDTTLSFAETLVRISPQMTFIFVSGGSTDSTEQGKSMWARVKGRTENALARIGFAAEYNFRPGLMKPYREQKNVKTIFRVMGWLYPLLKFTPYVSTLQQVGTAMILAALHGAPKQVLEVKDINALADSAG